MYNNPFNPNHLNNSHENQLSDLELVLGAHASNSPYLSLHLPDVIQLPRLAHESNNRRKAQTGSQATGL